ncbi:hypothetical protein [Phycicoccus sp. SLBN-51]|uniref:hypothetical protein n=1 Tax=Phycicoccus sp. SLBN-51 TaxID=2768447 RepID=UPI00114D7D0B|nr:hypothetical protein [Phycicoccus sp. SLBN-51]TQJ49199.1 hypothetical protein FBY26_0873 [Phycicoccus sp. SLBN-51]
MSGARGETRSAQRFANYRAAWIPVLPLVALVGATLFRVVPGVVVLLLLATLVAIGVALLVALSPGVVIDGDRLGVPGREGRRRAPGGEVDLHRLTRVRSVSYQGGRVSGRGLALFRNQLLLEDSDGGQAMFWAWGWTPKAGLQEALRRAVVANRARMDPMSCWRLGFTNEGARVSPLRRLL